MKTFYIALAALAVLVSGAKAETIIEGVNFDIMFSAPEDIGDGLLATTLTAIGRGNAVLASFDGAIGVDGGLHHEQFPGRGGVIDPTPNGGDTDSAVDSQFLLDVQLAIAPLDETTDLVPSNVDGRDSFGPGVTGFGGVLSGNVSLNNPAATTPIARLVFAADGQFEFDFNLLPQSAIGGTENFAGAFPIPEPSAAILAALGLAGFGFRRR